MELTIEQQRVLHAKYPKSKQRKELQDDKSFISQGILTESTLYLQVDDDYASCDGALSGQWMTDEERWETDDARNRDYNQTGESSDRLLEYEVGEGGYAEASALTRFV